MSKQPSTFASLSKAFGQAAASAAKVAGQVASSAVSEVSAMVGVKCLRNYYVSDEQVTTAGPQQLWKIYRGKSKLEGVWGLFVLDVCGGGMSYRMDDDVHHIQITCTLLHTITHHMHIIPMHNPCE